MFHILIRLPRKVVVQLRHPTVETLAVVARRIQGLDVELRSNFTNQHEWKRGCAFPIRENSSRSWINHFRIERGDTLAEPMLVKGDHLMHFDVALANPPYSIKQ